MGMIAGIILIGLIVTWCWEKEPWKEKKTINRLVRNSRKNERKREKCHGSIYARSV